MKQTLSTLLLSLVSIICLAQTPAKINYQAIARDASGNVLVNESITADLKIVAGTVTGTVVYQEIHTVSTNEFGLFYFKIGEGVATPATALLNDVNWESGTYFLRVIVNGDILDPVELVSVPYALHAQSSGGINGVNISTNTPANGDILSYDATSQQWELIPGGSSTDDQIIQNFSINSSDSIITLDIENGGIQTIDLRPYLSGGGSDDQSVTSFSINPADSVLTFELEDGGGIQTVNLASYLLGDGTGTDDQVIQSFSINPADSLITLEIENGGGAQTIDLSSFLAGNGNIYNQDGTLTGNRTITTGSNTLTFFAQGLNPIASFNNNSTAGSNVLINSLSVGTPSLILANGGTQQGRLTGHTGGVQIEGGTGALDRVMIGTSADNTGKFNVTHSSLQSNPAVNLVNPATGLNRVQFQNDVTGYNNHFWEIGAETNNIGAGGFSINYFDGTTYKSNFITYNDGKAAFIAPGSSFAPGLNVSDVDFYGTTRMFDTLYIGSGATSYAFPKVDGTANQVLTTDGSGIVTWQAVGGSKIADLTGDTFIETDGDGTGTIDEIDFNLGGTHYFTMNGPTIEVHNSLQSVYLGDLAGAGHSVATFNNVFIGNGAGEMNTSGTNNTGVGRGVLNQATASSNNVAIGYESQYYTTTGSQNVSVGGGTLGGGNGGTDMTGNQNTAIGHGAMYVNTTGLNNVAMGLNSLYANSTGSSNTALGYSSLSNNIGGNSITSLGFQSNVASPNLNNATAIGANSYVSTDNSLVLGSIVGVNGAGANTNVGIGTTAPTELLYLLGNDADLDLETVDAAESSSFHLRRARGTAVLSPQPVQNNDSYANIQFQGFTGGDYENGARIHGAVDGLPGSTSMPGRLEFYTTPESAVVGQQRMVIKSDGKIGMGTSTPTSSLHVNGSFAAKVITHTGTYTLGADDQVSIWTNTSPFAATTVTLPSADFCQGRIYRITKVAPTSGSSTLTIATTGDFVDGQSSIAMVTSTSGGVELISDGSNWYVLSRF